MPAEASEEAIAQLVAAAAEHMVGRVDAVFEQGKGAHRLDRRSRRIQRVEHLVAQRLARVLGKHLPLGATDAVGLRAAEEKAHVHDIHATILRLLGLDHERLTFRHNGRDERLTDVAGEVINKVLA